MAANKKNPYPFRLLSELKKKDLFGRRVILRADFNVPIKGDKVVDSFRIKQSLPTLKFLSRMGVKTLIISHLGDSDGSLKPVARFLSRYFKINFSLLKTAGAKMNKLPAGEFLLLENLRQNAGEEKNRLAFAKILADFGDWYVNDAFSASHRRHASIVGLPKLRPALAGHLFVAEYKNLSAILSPLKPFLLILGGAKFATKLPLIDRYLTAADKIFIVGALAHIFFQKLGYEIGDSLVDRDIVGISRFLKSSKISLPVDVVVQTFAGIKIKKPETLSRRDVISDAGPATVKMISREIKGMKTILWNGPLGRFEDGFSQATEEVAKLTAAAKAHSVVGGGDTVAAIQKLKLEKKFSFTSTAGGAMLDFLATGTLPGIEALTLAKNQSGL